MKKSKLCKALAMAVALGGFGAGGMYASTIGAVNLPANGLGDVLIFPYYTTRDGYQTTLSFLNTDESNLIAVKFRFYEGYNSRDALDFNVLLSPGDVFAGVVEEGTSGPIFRRAPNDTTCTVPHIPFNTGSLPLSTAAFSASSLMPDNSQRANHDGGPSDSSNPADAVDRLREGYVVAIVMGHFPVPTAFPAAAPAPGTSQRILTDAVHYIEQNGVGATYTGKRGINTEAECVAAQSLFTNDAVNGRGVNIPTAALFGEPINSLRGNYTLLNVGRGTSVGSNAVALANFFTVTPLPTDTVTAVGVAPRTACTVFFSNQFAYPGGPIAWDPNTDVASCPNLITAQQPFWFLEPSLNDAYPPESIVINNAVPGAPGNLNESLGVTASFWSPSTSALGSTDVDYGFLAVSEVLRARTLVNEWSLNPALGVSSAWVVTHPTKGFFVDRNGFDSPQAAVNTLRFPSRAGDPASVPPIAVNGNLAPFANNFRGTTPTAGNGTSCNQVGYRLYNRDEVGSSPSAGGVTPSPDQPRPNLSLCYETNVIPLDPDNLVFSSRLLPQQVQNLYGSIDAVTNADPAMLKPFGWMRLDLNTDPANATTSLAGPGLPAIGFMLRQRVIPGTADTYSDISDHSVNR